MSQIANAAPRRNSDDGGWRDFPPERPITNIKVRLGERMLALSGRAAWALSELAAAGERGCTPIDNPGPRWSHYVWLLKRQGLMVETIHEPHAGAFAGHHARYVLRSPVTVLDVVRQGERRAA